MARNPLRPKGCRGAAPSAALSLLDDGGPYRLRRDAWHPGPRRWQRDPRGFFNNLLVSGLLATLILTGFGTVFTWVAFGPGERQFSGGVSIPGLSVGFLSGETPGRIAFGIAALCLDALALFAWTALTAAFFARRDQ